MLLFFNLTAIFATTQPSMHDSISTRTVTITAIITAVMPDITPDGKTEAADDNQCHDGEIHDRVCRVAAEAPACVCIRKHIKARVAERGDRVEHAVPQSLSEAELRQEAEKQQY